MTDRFELRWDGDQLRLVSDRLLATLERDPAEPGMVRVVLPGGHVTASVELWRAKEAAEALAVASLALEPLTIQADRLAS
jgi:hypothetical protein